MRVACYLLLVWPGTLPMDSLNQLTNKSYYFHDVTPSLCVVTVMYLLPYSDIYRLKNTSSSCGWIGKASKWWTGVSEIKSSAIRILYSKLLRAVAQTTHIQSVRNIPIYRLLSNSSPYTYPLMQYCVSDLTVCISSFSYTHAVY